MSKKIFTAAVLATLLTSYSGLCQQRIRSHAWAVNAARSLTTEETLRQEVEYLCSKLCEGRGSGTRGGTEAAMHIWHSFSQAGLRPLTHSGSYSLSGMHQGVRCHDIAGMLPGTTDRSRSRYIIVMAHYDGLGTIDGRTYPGADSNASGVAVMLSLMKMFAQVASESTLDHNIIFVGTDAKQHNLAGAQVLWKALQYGRLRDPVTGKPIRSSSVSMVVNLDILGGSSSPLKSGREDYLLLLGATGTLKGWMEGVNHYSGIRLEMCYDYYGSSGFTNLFLNRVSDQKPFREHGVPAVMFTSGISMDTNKEGDTPDKLNYGVMLRRTRAIYHWIDRLTYLL